MRLGGSLDSGVVIVYGPQAASTAATLDSPANVHLLELGTAEGGGYLTAYGPHDVPALRLGHYEPLQLSGLIAVTGSDQLEPADVPTDKSLWGAPLQWTPPGDRPSPPAADKSTPRAPRLEAAEQASERE